MIRSNKKGFTLLEILIVVVILGVVAGLALPQYFSTIEKSRAQEALSSLSATRQAMIQYFSETGDYSGAIIGNAANTTGNLSYNPNYPAGGQVLIFSYALSNLGPATFTATATRTGGTVVGTVTMNQAGVITKTGAYA